MFLSISFCYLLFLLLLKGLQIITEGQGQGGDNSSEEMSFEEKFEWEKVNTHRLWDNATASKRNFSKLSKREQGEQSTGVGTGDYAKETRVLAIWTVEMKRLITG